MIREYYDAFASVYERLMANVPYDAWVRRITKLFKETGIDNGLVVDLGCGTGSVTRRLAAKGYEMIGIDISEEMLSEAWVREKGFERDHTAIDPITGQMHSLEGIKGPNLDDFQKPVPNSTETLYLQQDIRCFELFGTVRAIISCCDVINYIVNPAEVETIFRLVNNYLDPQGLFVMDFNTPWYYSQVLGNNTITEINDDLVLLWENEETEEGLHQSSLTIFQQQLTGDYTRFDEAHLQRGYSMKEIYDKAEKAGLVDIQFFDGYTVKPATNRSERIVMTARENGKGVSRKFDNESQRAIQREIHGRDGDVFYPVSLKAALNLRTKSDSDSDDGDFDDDDE